MRENDNVLARYKAKQFIRILSETKPLVEFDVDLYFAMIEKMTVIEGTQIIVRLLDGMSILATSGHDSCIIRASIP